MSVQNRVFVIVVLAAAALVACGRVSTDTDTWTWQRRDCDQREETASDELSMRLLIADDRAVLERRAAGCEVSIIDISVETTAGSTFLNYSDATAACNPAGSQGRYEVHLRNISGDADVFGTAPADETTQADVVECPADAHDPATSTASFENRFLASFSGNKLSVSPAGVDPSHSCTDYYVRE